MALFDLNRSNDTPIATLKLAEIVPEVWPTLPDVQSGEAPEYLGDVTYNWPYNGSFGDDVNMATANATGYYEPKNQGNKASIMGLPLAVDITTPRGWIDPLEPYAPPPTPTLTSLDPASIALPQTNDVLLHIHGTNFMPSSQLLWNGGPDRATFISPTELTTIIRGGPATTPYSAEVKVLNAGVASNALTLEFTAA